MKAQNNQQQFKETTTMQTLQLSPEGRPTTTLGLKAQRTPLPKRVLRKIPTFSKIIAPIYKSQEQRCAAPMSKPHFKRKYIKRTAFPRDENGPSPRPFTSKELYPFPHSARPTLESGTAHQEITELQDLTNRQLYFVQKPPEEVLGAKHYQRWLSVFQRVKGDEFDRKMGIKKSRTSRRQSAHFNKTLTVPSRSSKSRRDSAASVAALPQTFKQLMNRRSQTSLHSKKTSLASVYISSDELEIESTKQVGPSTRYDVLAESNKLPRVVWESQMRRMSRKKKSSRRKLFESTMSGLESAA